MNVIIPTPAGFRVGGLIGVLLILSNNAIVDSSIVFEARLFDESGHLYIKGISLLTKPS
jgi:hypothetical protein